MYKTLDTLIFQGPVSPSFNRSYHIPSSLIFSLRHFKQYFFLIKLVFALSTVGDYPELSGPHGSTSTPPRFSPSAKFRIRAFYIRLSRLTLSQSVPNFFLIHNYHQSPHGLFRTKQAPIITPRYSRICS